MADSEPRRRNNDVEAADLYPKVEEAIAHITRLEETVKTHGHPQLEENVNQIIDVLEGPAVAQPFGQPSTRKDGIVDKVNTLVEGQEALRDALGNGGIKIKLPWPVWVAIVGALADLGVQIIQGLRSST